MLFSFFHSVGSGMEAGGSIAWTQYNANLDLPLYVIQDNETARIELHRKALGVEFGQHGLEEYTYMQTLKITK